MTRLRDCLLFAALTSVISTGALAQANTQVSALADSGSGWFSDWSKEDKALALNLGVGAAVLGWGVANWDYGSGGPRFQSEGWFDRETEEGGADKLGHFYSAYLFSHLFAGQYERWDFDKDQAIRWGALSSLGVTGLIEVGDAFSDYGFSYEDMISNTLGVAAGYLLWSSPELSRKIDLRVEYNPFHERRLRRRFHHRLRPLELPDRVQGRGVRLHRKPVPEVPRTARRISVPATTPTIPASPMSIFAKQYLYVGIGLNLSRLFRPYLDVPVFNYVQVPYTYIPATYQISGPQ